jgi:hypothetical protein
LAAVLLRESANHTKPYPELAVMHMACSFVSCGIFTAVFPAATTDTARGVLHPMY